jgi:predicted RecB family nuclease
LVGHPDLVDKGARVVYEIKPQRLRPSYSVQLEAYAEMLEALEGGEWATAFVLYDKDGNYTVQPTFRKRGALRALDDLARTKLLLEKAGKKLLIKGMCDFCARKSGCELVRLGLSALAV